MAKIYIDNQEYEADERKNILATALSLGFNVPYFCWHPCLNSVGACRQCAVKQYRGPDDENGMIVMSCMTPAADGTRISIDDPEVVHFRSEIIEWLMINHPHDCAVCEEGGECHLQDMTWMTGHTSRRYRGLKRTHRNQYLGSFISHEMNRCIACYRCTRFYRDYAGGHDLDEFGPHNHVYFGRHEDGVLENEFSGNLVEVCPTGVFTDKTLGSQYTRKWDLKTTTGICTHCSLGCNTSPGERRGVLKRVQNRYHGDINGYFLCDRGRFGAGFVNREDRPRQPQLKAEDNGLQPVDSDHARVRLTQMLRGAEGIVGIGSPRASLESNYALRQLVGEDNFATGMAAHEQNLVDTALAQLHANPERIRSLSAAENSDAVLILGEDVTNSAPRLALTLRQTARNAQREAAVAKGVPNWHDRAVRDIAADVHTPVYNITTHATKLDDIACETARLKPASIAGLGFAVAHALDADAPAPTGIDADTQALAENIAATLRDAERPLIVAGSACGDADTLNASGNIAQALGERGGLFLPLPEANSAGLGLMGGMDVESALARINDGDADTLIVLENDLYQHIDQPTVDAALDKADNVVALDHSMQATLTRATAVLPAGSAAESDGTLVNNETRAQRYFQLYVPDEPIKSGWRWLSDMLDMVGQTNWDKLDDVITAMTSDIPALAQAINAAPNASFRESGLRVPRDTHRNSSRTAIYANESVHERRPAADHDSPLSYSMEGWGGQRPGALLPFSWAPGWNSNQQSITRFQDEVAGHLKGGDPGIYLVREADQNRNGYNPANHVDNPAWQAVSLHHIFGSEQISALAPAVAERVPAPYCLVHPEDAEQLELAEGSTLTLTLSGMARTLPVQLRTDLARGSIGVPVNLEGLEGIRLPQELAL